MINKNEYMKIEEMIKLNKFNIKMFEISDNENFKEWFKKFKKYINKEINKYLNKNIYS